MDPIGYIGGILLYSYVNNNPIDSTDILGHYPLGGFPVENPQCGTCRCHRKPKDCSNCWDYCNSDEVKELFRSEGNPDGLVVCRADGCKCACSNMNLNQHSNPKNRAEELIRQCIADHEEQHITDGATCIYCCSPPCKARHTIMTWWNGGECNAYNTQVACLTKAMLDPTCDRDCQNTIYNEILFYKEHMRDRLGCSTSLVP